MKPACKHHISKSCMCSMQGSEPDEDCPVHGVAERRCDLCGRFLSWADYEKALSGDKSNE